MGFKKIFHIKSVRRFGKNTLSSRQKEDRDGKVELCNKVDEVVSDALSEKRQEASNETMQDQMTQDLMRLVGSAIEEWARLYGMENLPKKIIFQQALTILNSMNKLLFK